MSSGNSAKIFNPSASITKGTLFPFKKSAKAFIVVVLVPRPGPIAITFGVISYFMLVILSSLLSAMTIASGKDV